MPMKPLSSLKAWRIIHFGFICISRQLFTLSWPKKAAQDRRLSVYCHRPETAAYLNNRTRKTKTKILVNRSYDRPYFFRVFHRSLNSGQIIICKCVRVGGMQPNHQLCSYEKCKTFEDGILCEFGLTLTNQYHDFSCCEDLLLWISNLI